MASRFLRSCSPARAARRLRFPFCSIASITCAVSLAVFAPPAAPQFRLKPPLPGEPVSLMPSDIAILESGEARKDLPCNVFPRKSDLGFDLRFHTGYDVALPINSLQGDEQLLTIVFRIYSTEDKLHPAYFVQHFRVPAIPESAKGEAALSGSIDVGEGAYHVDWLMRDRAERICSSSWDIEAALSPKDKPITLFIAPNQIAETIAERFVNEPLVRPPSDAKDDVHIKLLVNFAPQVHTAAVLQKIDTDPLVSILKAIERDPRISRLSLVAFNMDEERVLYRQNAAERIDFPALGKALETMKLGTVRLQQLSQKHSETDFLENLIQQEIGTSSHPDAVVFAGPKAMLEADVPQEDLRRIGNVECPVFYMNYNLNPQAIPWKDSISHAIRVFKGTEYTISRPRDLWVSTTEMMSRIVRSKRQHTVASVVGTQSR